MTEPCPAPMVALAQRLADSSGSVVRRYFRTPVAIDDKADASPVTIADREAEHVIRTLIESQRPDDGIAFDSLRTALGGYSAQINFSKRGGGSTRFNFGYQALSPGFEINDVGFLSRANSQNQ